MSGGRGRGGGNRPGANPYPDIDPRTAAAILEQQSAYSNENKLNATIRQAQKLDRNHKHKTVIREGGGKVWEDPSLLEWDPSHFRLYCGNLGGEIHDDSLRRAFSAYKSVVKAKVIRDKKTSKSKGFGFVSFVEPEDMLNAWRDLNGKYIGSHPVKLTKADTQVKAITIDRDSLKAKQAKSTFAQNVVQTGRVEKKKPKPIGAFVPRGVKK